MFTFENTPAAKSATKLAIFSNDVERAVLQEFLDNNPKNNYRFYGKVAGMPTAGIDARPAAVVRCLAKLRRSRETYEKSTPNCTAE